MVITAHICTLRHGSDSYDFVEGSVGFIMTVRLYVFIHV